MKKNFLEFIAENKKRIDIYESFKNKDLDKALSIIENILKKKIENKLISIPGFTNTTIDNNSCISKQYIVFDGKNSSLFQINWLVDSESTSAYSIDFFKDLHLYWTGEGKSDLSVYTLGTNINKLLPIIWDVVNSQNYSLSKEDAIKLASNKYDNVKETKLTIEDSTFIIYEGFKKSILDDAFKLNVLNNINEDSEEDNIKIAIERRKLVKVQQSDNLKEQEEKLNKGRKNPDQIFKEMSKYISLVLKGLQPSLILCGAPGVGKTFRVKKQLKENGYKEGENMMTAKGKCTARKLYLTLYQMKEKNNIVLIDDADSLVGPKADENCINILKAALDSTTDDEGRLVTYGVAGKIMDDEGNEIPKKFYFKGGCIVITNYKAGALDTALRGRSFIQDIDFTNAEVLEIIEKLLPNIEPQILNLKAKYKSLKYLKELDEKGSDMELSLRTFVLCAKIFKACDGDDTFTDDDAKSMIEEQMKLQYMRERNSKY